MGGSSGCIPPLIQLLSGLPPDFTIPVVIIIHRMKNVKSEMENIFPFRKKIRLPEDKEQIQEGRIYLAPQNYHLLIEEERIFSMDNSEPVNYCIPSIDVTFMSAAEVYKENTVGILLSGANNDGAEGINKIIGVGGIGIVQDPTEAQCPTMPEAAIKGNEKVKILNIEKIIQMLLTNFCKLQSSQ